jgi:hypothetical protein
MARDNNFAGVVIVTQVNPGFTGPRLRAFQLSEDGTHDSMFVLEDETITFRRPVLFIHGDSHEFRIDKPLLGSRSGATLDNFTRMEVPGSADVYWVKVTVDPAKAHLWSYEHVDIPASFIAQQNP